jgi:hypothetical protein
VARSRLPASNHALAFDRGERRLGGPDLDQLVLEIDDPTLREEIQDPKKRRYVWLRS